MPIEILHLVRCKDCSVRWTRGKLTYVPEGYPGVERYCVEPTSPIIQEILNHHKEYEIGKGHGVAVLEGKGNKALGEIMVKRNRITQELSCISGSLNGHTLVWSSPLAWQTRDHD